MLCVVDSDVLNSLYLSLPQVDKTIEKNKKKLFSLSEKGKGEMLKKIEKKKREKHIFIKLKITGNVYIKKSRGETIFENVLVF